MMRTHGVVIGLVLLAACSDTGSAEPDRLIVPVFDAAVEYAQLGEWCSESEPCTAGLICAPSWEGRDTCITGQVAGEWVIYLQDNDSNIEGHGITLTVDDGGSVTGSGTLEVSRPDCENPPASYVATYEVTVTGFFTSNTFSVNFPEVTGAGGSGMVAIDAEVISAAHNDEAASGSYTLVVHWPGNFCSGYVPVTRMSSGAWQMWHCHCPEGLHCFMYDDPFVQAPQCLP